MTHTYKWPMSAVGSGTIFYRRTATNGSLRVGCSLRNALVGEGFGISSGGFAEVKDVVQKPIGYVQPMLAEAWRENFEEIPGFEKIINWYDYVYDAQFLTSFLVRKDDENKVHTCIYYGFEITAAEEEAIAACPPSNETSAGLQFMDIVWTPGKFNSVRLPMEDGLFHKHEAEAFKALVKLADQNRLWGRSN